MKLPLPIVFFFLFGIVIVNSGKEKPNECFLPPESGLCHAYMPKYFFDASKRKCEIFIYGGCNGNANRFNTWTQCNERCGDSRPKRAIRAISCGLSPEAGLCKASITRYYYDSKGNVCKNFVYGGCGGNENNFHSAHDCQSACSGFRKKRSPVGRCALPLMSGFCKAAFKRFRFDSQSNRCEQFLYGGCGGNENNFRSMADCQRACEEF